jgi:MFS family permease
MPYSEAAYLVTIVNGAGVPARFAIPLLADRYGAINLLIPSAFCLTVTAFAWLAASDRIGMYVWAAFYGLCSGGFQSLIPTGYASITKELNTLGTRLGMGFTVMSFAALTGPPLGGAIQSAPGGGYRAAQVWAAVSTLSCATMLATARMRKVGWELRKKC